MSNFVKLTRPCDEEGCTNDHRVYVNIDKAVFMETVDIDKEDGKKETITRVVFKDTLKEERDEMIFVVEPPEQIIRIMQES